jgi:hypothetical protein
MMNAATVAAKRPVFQLALGERWNSEVRGTGKRWEAWTYKDEDALRVSLPVLRKYFVLSISLGEVNGPHLAGRIAL